jgi:signal transduction histidine kinase
MDSKQLAASAIGRAQAELEEALSELEKMPAFDIGSVAFSAHALNNYLTVTAAAIKLMKMHLADQAGHELHTWLDSAEHGTNLMARIVGQLMNARSTTETSFRLEKFDLPSLVQRACDYYQAIADHKQIRVLSSLSTNVPPVWADRVAVAAVLDNLLSNAVKYSPGGRQIWVEVHPENTWVVCSVQDEGPGLSQEDQRNLFKRGVRLTPKPTAGETSIGYGLSVAKDLIEKFGGLVWCESTLGQGARFSFRLPAYQDDADKDPRIF